ESTEKARTSRDSPPTARDPLPKFSLWWTVGCGFCASCCATRSHPPARPPAPLSNRDDRGQFETVPPYQESEEGLRLGIRTCMSFVTRRVHQAAQGVCGLGAVRSARPGTSSRSDREKRELFLPAAPCPGLRNRGKRALRCWREPHT